MTVALSPQARRAVALAILVGVLVIVWSLAVWPLIRLAGDRQADIAVLSGRLNHLHALIARKPGLDRRLHVVQARLVKEGGFWTGASAPAIAAEVQDRLRAVVAASGGRIKSASEASEAAERGFRKITVRFRIEGTLDTLQRTLGAIDTTRPSLFVDRFIVSAPASPSDGSHPPILDLDLDVAGYMRGAPS